MTKFEIILIETVTVKRKTKYIINAENEQEILAARGKSIDFLDVIEGETLLENDMDTSIIDDIVKAKVITNEEKI